MQLGTDNYEIIESAKTPTLNKRKASPDSKSIYKQIKRPRALKQPKRPICTVRPGKYLATWRVAKKQGRLEKWYVDAAGFIFFGSEAKTASRSVANVKIESTFAESRVERWGVPEGIAHRWQTLGIKKLFDWQVECLNSTGALEGKNLVYCAPTSGKTYTGGKSLVAEVLLIRGLLRRQARVLYVLPYIAIVEEKTKYLQELLGPYFKIEGLHGSSDKSWHPYLDIAVCTIEKASNVVSRLIEEGSQSRLGCVVMDEIHMIGEESRGPTIEMLLTKLKWMDVQLIGMSATLPNVREIAHWLDASLYISDFRPTELTELVAVKNTIFTKTGEVLKETEASEARLILSLCKDYYEEQVLVFCPTKRACEKLAEALAKELNKTNLMAAAMLLKLKHCGAGLCEVLERTIGGGVAYHHSDLTTDERQIIEHHYREGDLRVLVATSTLAVGVNLPAGLVVFSSPYVSSMQVGIQFLTPARYKQMSGRAGRMGKRAQGTSCVLCKPNEFEHVMELLNRPQEPVQSMLEGEAALKGLLEALAIKLVPDSTQLQTFWDKTLRARQCTDDLAAYIGELRTLDYINDLQASTFGIATYAGSLAPTKAKEIYRELKDIADCLSIESNLPLLFITVSPAFTATVNWDILRAACNTLPPTMIEWLCLQFIDIDYINRSSTIGAEKDADHSQYIRLYIAVILTELINEVPISKR
jgi:DNA polymerase theta